MEPARPHSGSRVHESFEENIQNDVWVFGIGMAFRRFKPEKKMGIGETVKGNG
jgi:hypothetical protein